MAIKPEDGDWYAWDGFVGWCENHGVDMSAEDTENVEGDWQIWWDCWKQGYSAAMQ